MGFKFSVLMGLSSKVGVEYFTGLIYIWEEPEKITFLTL